MTVKFARLTHPPEAEAVERIIERALPMFNREIGYGRWRAHDIRMDLLATHATTPLRLEALAQAEDVDLAHDVTGIYQHLNRETGLLEDFTPRYAQ